MLKNKSISLIALLITIPLQMLSQEIKIGHYEFKDGGEYQGELFKGKPYGRGKTVFENGDVYEGEYVKGKRQG
ncbi:MAG TPA: phosphatidylinositol-4-phosphate 5-kinase, partial [Candidatus Paraprevotella stercorigallinarum]|nr:phosphatidylinositol-4-phosphate 5-kinase [Candidatus Paraprevotella stercorigallinarum]